MRRNLTPDDEFYFDPYEDDIFDQPTVFLNEQSDDIFDQPTVFLDEEADVVDEAGIANVEAKIYDILDTSALANAYSKETPGMAFMYTQAIGKALRKPEVRELYRQFMIGLFSQTEETMLAHRHNPDEYECEEYCEDCFEEEE